MTNSIRISLVMLILSLFIFSCVKDDTLPAARISILSPAPLAEYDIFDTIAVGVLIQASVDLDVSLTVQLLNESFIPVQPARVIENVSTNNQLTVLFPIIDSTLADGVYNLKAQAYGGITTTQTYRQIRINEIPQSLKNIWVVGENPDFITVKVYDPNFQLQKEITIESDYAGSAVSSTNGQFYIAGAKSGNFAAYNGYTHTREWFIPGIPNPNQPYFTFARAYGDICFAGFWQGQVIGYNKFGGVVTATAFNEFTVPVDVFIHDAFLLKYATQRSNAQQKMIETYFVQSGAKISEQNITFEAVGFSAPQFRKILIFGNDNQQTVAFLYDLTSGLITSPYQPFALPDEKLLATTRVDDSKTLLAMQGGIYIYDYEKSIVQINSFQDVSSLTFNHLNQTILAVADTEMIAMTLQGEIFFQLNAQMPLLDIHLLFSK